MTITFFKNIFDKKPHYTNPQQIFEVIRSGGKQLDLIKQIRNTVDKEARNELKKNLGVILWSGKFTERRTEGLIEHSHLICLDFDGVDSDEWKEYLKTKPFVWAAFESPSGDGCKAIIQVSSANHLGHFKALAKELQEVDPSGKDVPRACFLSYDPEIYINEHHEIYTKIVESVYNDEQKYEKLKNWLSNKGEKFTDGHRNNFLAKLSGACNRFGIDKDFVIERFEIDYVRGTDFSIREAQGVVHSIYERYADQHDTVSFDEAIDEKKFVDDIMSTEIETNDIITVNDCRDDLLRDFDEGTPMGNTTHFPVFDNHFRWLKGEITTMTGVAASGKSTMLVQMLLCRAAFNKEKFALLSIEQYPPTFFYKELVRSVVGKPLEQGYPNRMTRQEFERGLEWVNEHFYFIYPESSDPSPEWTLARFYESIIKYSIDGCVVDPYNSQAHDYKSAGGRDDRYIAQMLNKSQRFALTNNVYYVTVAHPRSIGKNDDGTYKSPSADEISGGSSWWQRSDNILIFHRPSLPIDFQDPTCILKSAKIKKQSVNGKPGETTLIFDWRTGRFSENNYTPLNKFKL